MANVNNEVTLSDVLADTTTNATTTEDEHNNGGRDSPVIHKHATLDDLMDASSDSSSHHSVNVGGAKKDAAADYVDSGEGEETTWTDPKSIHKATPQSNPGNGVSDPPTPHSESPSDSKSVQSNPDDANSDLPSPTSRPNNQSPPKKMVATASAAKALLQTPDPFAQTHTTIPGAHSAAINISGTEDEIDFGTIRADVVEEGRSGGSTPPIPDNEDEFEFVGAAYGSNDSFGVNKSDPSNRMDNVRVGRAVTVGFRADNVEEKKPVVPSGGFFKTAPAEIRKSTASRENTTRSLQSTNSSMQGDSIRVIIESVQIRHNERVAKDGECYLLLSLHSSSNRVASRRSASKKVVYRASDSRVTVDFNEEIVLDRLSDHNQTAKKGVLSASKDGSTILRIESVMEFADSSPSTKMIHETVVCEGSRIVRMFPFAHRDVGKIVWEESQGQGGEVDFSKTDEIGLLKYSISPSFSPATTDVFNLKVATPATLIFSVDSVVCKGTTKTVTKSSAPAQLPQKKKARPTMWEDGRFLKSSNSIKKENLNNNESLTTSELPMITTLSLLSSPPIVTASAKDFVEFTGELRSRDSCGEAVLIRCFVNDCGTVWCVGSAVVALDELGGEHEEGEKRMLRRKMFDKGAVVGYIEIGGMVWSDDVDGADFASGGGEMAWISYFDDDGGGFDEDGINLNETRRIQATIQSTRYIPDKYTAKKATSHMSLLTSTKTLYSGVLRLSLLNIILPTTATNNNNNNNNKHNYSLVLTLNPSSRTSRLPWKRTSSAGGRYISVRENVTFPLRWSYRETIIPSLIINVVRDDGVSVAQGSLDLPVLVVNDDGRWRGWVDIDSHNISREMAGGGAVGLEVAFSTDEFPASTAAAHAPLENIEGDLVSSLPSNVAHLDQLAIPKNLPPPSSTGGRKPVTGGPVASGLLHLTIYDYLPSSRRSSPHFSFCLKCKIRGGGEEICHPMSLTGDSIEFGGSSVMLQMYTSSLDQILQLELCESEVVADRDTETPVVAEAKAMVLGKVLEGHVLRQHLPMRSLVDGEKAGYLQIGMQFLPGRGGKKVKKESKNAWMKSEKDSGHNISEKVPISPAIGNSGSPLLTVHISSCRNLRSPGWPGRKEPYVTVSLLQPVHPRSKIRSRQGKLAEIQMLQTPLALTDGNEGGSATFSSTLRFNFPPSLLNPSRDPSFEMTHPRAVLVVTVRGSGRKNPLTDEQEVIGECRVPVPWGVIFRGRRQDKWHSLRLAAGDDGGGELANPVGTSSSRGEIRLTLRSEGKIPIQPPTSKMLAERGDVWSDEDSDGKDDDPFDNDGTFGGGYGIDDEDQEKNDMKQRQANNGPGLLIVQMTDLEISQGGETQNLSVRSISLNIYGEEKSKGISSLFPNTDLPRDLNTMSPTKSSSISDPNNRPNSHTIHSSMKIEMNEDISRQARPVSLPIPHTTSTSMNMSVSITASHGMSLFNSNLSALTAMSSPGVELEEWVSMTPVVEPLTGHQPSDTPLKILRPAFGRARIRMRYVPHTSGNVTLKLMKLNLADYIRNQCSLRSIFVRARVLPGGSWVCSKLQENADTKLSDGVDLGAEKLSLPIDTTSLPVRPGGHIPEVEFCIFDNGDDQIYNLLGKGTLPLSSALCEGFNKANDAIASKKKEFRFNRILLLDSHSERGSGINGRDITMDAGGLDIGINYRHESTPASAIGELDAATDANEGIGDEEENFNNSNSFSIANAESQLKNLFYRIQARLGTSAHGNESIPKSELIAAILSKNSHWASLINEVRGKPSLPTGVNNDDDDEAISDTNNNADFHPEVAKTAATEIQRVFESSSVCWEEWLAYLETLRTVGSRQNGVVDEGIMQRNMQLASLFGKHNGNVAASVTQTTANKENDPPPSSPSRSQLIGRKREAFSPATKSPSHPRHVPKRGRKLTQPKGNNHNIDPVSGLPYTESDYKRMEAEDTRKRLGNLQQSMNRIDGGSTIESLQQVNAKLRHALLEEKRAARLMKVKKASAETRKRRQMQQAIELDKLSSNHLETNPANQGTVYGIDGLEDIINRRQRRTSPPQQYVTASVLEQSKLLQLSEINKILRKSIRSYQVEAEKARAAQRAAEQEKERMENTLSRKLQASRRQSYFAGKMGNRSPTSSPSATDLLMSNDEFGEGSENFKKISQAHLEMSVSAGRYNMQVEALKAENSELRGEKLTLARRAGRATDSEPVLSAPLELERQRTSELNNELERARRIIAAHEREAIHKNAEHKLTVLAAARERARREENERSRQNLRENQNEASKKIQNAAVGWKVKKEFKKKQEDAVIIQSVLRSSAQKKKFKARLAKESTAASLIQGTIRGKKVRKAITKQKRGTPAIQSLWRGSLCRMQHGLILIKYKQQRKVAATTIQSGRRMQMSNRRVRNLMIRVSLMQAKVKMVLAKKRYTDVREMVMRMQRGVRCWSAQKLLRELVVKSVGANLAAALNHDGVNDGDAVLTLEAAFRKALDTEGVDIKLISTAKKALKKLKDRIAALSAVSKVITSCNYTDTTVTIATKQAMIEKITKTVTEAEDLGVEYDHKDVMRAYTVRNDIEKNICCCNLDSAVTSGDLVEIEKRLEEAYSTEVENDNTHIISAQRAIVKIKAENLRVKNLAELSNCIGNVKKDVDNSDWAREFNSIFALETQGETFKKSIMSKIAQCEKGSFDSKNTTADAIKAGKTVIALVDRIIGIEKARRAEISRVSKVHADIKSRREKMTAETEQTKSYLTAITRASIGGNDENSDLRSLLFQLGKKMLAEADAKGKDELSNVLCGPIWAVEDDLGRRLKRINQELVSIYAEEEMERLEIIRLEEER